MLARAIPSVLKKVDTRRGEPPPKTRNSGAPEPLDQRPAMETERALIVAAERLCAGRESPRAGREGDDEEWSKEVLHLYLPGLVIAQV